MRPTLCMAARHRDHARLLAPLEPVDQQPGEGEVAEVVRAELKLEAVGRLAPRGGHHAGVVDQQVETVVVGAHALGKRAHRVEAREVELLHHELRARDDVLDRAPGRVALGRAATREHHTRALARQLPCRHEAESAVGAGHDRQASALVGDPVCCPLAAHRACSISLGNRGQSCTCVHIRGRGLVTTVASTRIREKARIHAQGPPEQRHRRPLEPQRWSARRGRPDRAVQLPLRGERLLTGGPAPPPAQGDLQAPPAGARRGRDPRCLARRRGRPGDEGVGARARRDPLHPRLPAAHGADRGEARLVLRPHQRRPLAGRVLRQRADPGRARCLIVSDGRRPRHLRGARLHGLGSHEPGLHPREPQWGAALHPDGVRVLDR